MKLAKEKMMPSLRNTTLTLLVGLSPVAAVQAEEADIEALKPEAKAVIQQLASTLMQELKAAKQEGGAIAAIKVCNTKAMPLTDQVAQANGWEVGRTSLKLRNPQNAPDAWESSVLEEFQQQAEQGADIAAMMHAEVVENAQGEKVFRVMKAIPVGEQCLACHGSNIKPELAEQLDALYPEDQARGFKAGDLRGAFTLKKVL